MSTKDPGRYMPRLMLALITSIVTIAVPVDARVRPQIVVGIMIDGLDTQYIDLLRSKFGESGFNRLLRDGVVIANADYGTNVDATAATAMIMTGAAPSTTTVTGSTIYDRDAQRVNPAMYDAQALGNYTNETYSPRQLSVSTLADEVRIAGGGVTRVLAISPEASQSIILAGHSANCALWLNDNTGNWATSTYYKEVPATLNQRNRLAPLATRLDTVQWTPLRSAEFYPGLPEHLTHYPFRYVFARGAKDRYAMFKSSPAVNAEVTDLASRLIDDLKLGTADGVDMINLAYTLQPYDYTRNYDNRYELMDSYLRLDNNLAQLFAKVESTVGAGNAVFFVAATPPSTRSRRDDERWGIPYGEFSTKKAKSLLNMYLMAMFGNGEWVSSFHNDQFYLNHKLINDRSLDARTVRQEAASFLTRMSGVDRVYTLDEVETASGDAHLEAMRRNSDPNTAGDLFVETSPGWETVEDIDHNVPEQRIHYVNRTAPATAPIYILAPDVDARVIDTPVDARVIAPTVARLLRIRSPNGAALPALVL